MKTLEEFGWIKCSKYILVNFLGPNPRSGCFSRAQWMGRRLDNKHIQRTQQVNNMVACVINTLLLIKGTEFLGLLWTTRNQTQGNILYQVWRHVSTAVDKRLRRSADVLYCPFVRFIVGDNTIQYVNCIRRDSPVRADANNDSAHAVNTTKI